MTKDEILINYLNTINLGHNTLGVQAASQRYFGKDVSKLNLSECAVIAGITQNPTKYDPITHPGANDQRRKIVLQYMLEQGYIEEEAYEEALKDLVYTRISQVDRVTDDNAINSYFVDALTDQLLQDLQTICGYSEQQAFTLLFSGGLRIYSTQDPEIQQICDEVTSNPANYPARVGYYLNYQLTTEWDNGELHNYSTEMMELWYKDQNPLFSLIFNSYDEAVECYENYREHILAEEGGTVNDEFISITPQPQISLTVEDQSTGYIVAMVGGRGNKEANRTLNRAYSSMRQPGSTFKVVSTYAPAIDAAGMGLATIIQDEPYNYPDGTPVKNWYGEAYRGPCTLRQGIMSSLNIVTVKCLNNIGIDLGYEYLEKFGITTLVDNYEVGGQVFSDKQLTMALGGLTLGVKNYELNAAYATIANGGMYLAPKLYSKVTDHDGNVIIDAARDREKHRVLHESAAWLLTSAMQDVVTKGTGTAVNFGTTSIAGKTGTTSDNNDVWFAGYTPDYTATVWAGYDENTKLRTSEEIALAKTIWRRVME
ncbi:MAG: transglycosylase domain-containing protein, partial [Lachnospiraceae bacterium]|nr:transglycosylase domain-containing protein [Lachnospiraceae bacterium]